MLEGIPISGYAICFGPLALTVIGFIVFAALTDVNARRTYLRRRPHHDEQGTQPVVTKRINVETPAGVPVTLVPPQLPGETEASKPPELEGKREVIDFEAEDVEEEENGNGDK